MQTRSPSDPVILTINSGSSSIKFALYRAADPPQPMLRGAFDRIGLSGTELAITDAQTQHVRKRPSTASNHRECAAELFAWVAREVGDAGLYAVGHRVVHGGKTYRRSERVTPTMIAELRQLSPYDPEHMPAELDLIEAFATRHPTLPQVACFDTAFHRDMPRVACLLPIPRRYERLGLQRYGFHGLSYASLMKQLAAMGEPHEVNGRIILAHLGNGASMAAVRNGRCIDTTMGFTPASGLVMSRRAGDLDPGIVAFLSRTEGMDVEHFHRMVNTESGLLGLSETSPDMRDLLERESHDPRCAEAIALFCYQAKKMIGAFAAALGGLDTLVFTAGIGEHASAVRARICDGLGFLGLSIDNARNATAAPTISSPTSRVTVRVMHTDEEREIAVSVLQVLDQPSTPAE